MKTSSLFSKIFFALLFLSLTFLSSCSYRYYSPDDAKMMTFTDGNQVQFSGSSGLINRAVDVQGGYSPLNHIRLSGSYFARTGSGNNTNGFSDLPDMNGVGRLWTSEIGGYYFLKNKKHEAEKKSPSVRSIGLLIDLQQGFGWGKIKTNYIDIINNGVSVGNSNEGKSVITLSKSFQQLGVHWIDQYFEFGIAHRWGRLHYDEVLIKGVVGNNVRNSISNLENNNLFRINETTVRFSIAVFDMKLFGHITFLSDHPTLFNLGTYTNNFGGGLLIDVDRFWKKARK